MQPGLQRRIIRRAELHSCRKMLAVQTPNPWLQLPPVVPAAPEARALPVVNAHGSCCLEGYAFVDMDAAMDGSGRGSCVRCSRGFSGPGCLFCDSDDAGRGRLTGAAGGVCSTGPTYQAQSSAKKNVCSVRDAFKKDYPGRRRRVLQLQRVLRRRPELQQSPQ